MGDKKGDNDLLSMNNPPPVQNKGPILGQNPMMQGMNPMMQGMNPMMQGMNPMQQQMMGMQGPNMMNPNMNPGYNPYMPQKKEEPNPRWRFKKNSKKKYIFIYKMNSLFF